MRRLPITESSTTRGGRSLIARPGDRSHKKDLAEAAKLLGDRSTGLAQVEAYREALRSWNRLVEDPSGTPTPPLTNTTSSSASPAPSTPRKIGRTRSRPIAWR